VTEPAPRQAGGQPRLVAQALALIRYRPLVYAVGCVLGGLAVATGRRELFWAMAAVLLAPAAAAALTRAAKPRRWRLTLEGRLAFIFALGFLAAGLNTGTNLLYFLFALLTALLAVSLGASAMTFRWLFVRRRVPVRVRAGDTFDVDVSVRNDKRLPAFALVVEEARLGALDPGARPAVFLPWAGGRDTIHGHYETRFLRRGEHTLDGVALETRFPFGLIARRIEMAAPQVVLATPAVFPVRKELLDRPGNAEGVARRILLTEERRDVVRSLRDYRSGDHPRRIHWRASARRGALVVKDFERTEPQRALVVLDTFRASLPPPAGGRAGVGDVVEEAVSVAASLVVALRDRGMCVGLAARVPTVTVFPPDRGASAARLASVLARLVPPLDGDLAELARSARRAAERARVIVVTTRPEAEAREALATLGADAPEILPLAAPGDWTRYLEGPVALAATPPPAKGAA
jgi:uncharacterized protein (DUF58 family)